MIGATFLLTLVWPHRVFAKFDMVQRRRYHLITALSYNFNSVQTKSTATTSNAKTNTTFQALEFGGDYFLAHRLAVTGQMLFSLSSSVDAAIKGYDLGFRYYIFKMGHETEANILGTKIETTPGWTPFLHTGFAARDYDFSNSSLSFQGFEAGSGVDYHYKQHRFIRGSLDYQSLKNTSARQLSGFSAALAFGLSL